MKFTRTSEGQLPYDGKLLVLIIYDIVDNRKRQQLAKFLKGYAVRVQKSAFEAYLDRKKRDRLIGGLPAYIGKGDSIRVYILDREREVLTFGEESDWESQDIMII